MSDIREDLAKIICCLAEGKPNDNDDNPGLNDSSDCDYCKRHGGCPGWPDVSYQVDSIIRYLISNNYVKEFIVE